MKRKVYDITSKLVSERPMIIWEGKELEVNNDFGNVLKVESLNLTTEEGIKELVDTALGEEHGIDIHKTKVPNMNVLIVVILAAMQGLEYEEAEKMFRTK